MKEYYGEEIKKMRRAKDMTIYDLAKKSEISAVEISQIENSKRRPRMKTLKKMAEALECDFEQLFHLFYD